VPDRFDDGAGRNLRGFHFYRTVDQRGRGFTAYIIIVDVPERKDDGERPTSGGLLIGFPDGIQPF
jgi:hypothetical protein